MPLQQPTSNASYKACLTIQPAWTSKPSPTYVPQQLAEPVQLQSGHDSSRFAQAPHCSWDHWEAWRHYNSAAEASCKRKWERKIQRQGVKQKNARVLIPLQVSTTRRNKRISIVSCARNTAESLPRTTQATVPNTTKMAQSNRRGAAVSTLPTRLRRSRMVIPMLNLKIESLRKWTRNLRKLSSPLLARRSLATTVIAIPTPNRKLGWVVWGN